MIKLVLIEDNPADVKLLREALKFANIAADLIHFSDGVEAVENLRSEARGWQPPPDLVFLDLNMPRLNGFDVLERIRCTPCCTSVPVAIFTSSHSPGDVERATTLRANRFIRKPTELFQFFEVVALAVRELAGKPAGSG